MQAGLTSCIDRGLVSRSRSQTIHDESIERVISCWARGTAAPEGRRHESALDIHSASLDISSKHGTTNSAPYPSPNFEADPTQHVEAFKALAHLTRLQVFFFLVRAEREVPAGEIQEAVEVPGPDPVPPPGLLRRAGLVQSRREERYIYYSVRRDTATALVRLLTACC